MIRARMLATFFAAALAVAAGASLARAQVSPGDLAAPHAALDGTTRCFECHDANPTRDGLDARCLKCHREIAWLRDHHRALHARQAAKACASCHPDHGGRDFAMVAWDSGTAEKFDHRDAGWALAGRHATAKCRDCHKPAYQKSRGAALIRKKDRAASWLGLETTCVACHPDPHRGQIGVDCERCHRQDKWKPAPGFDHARSKYPLEGAHARVECAKCHTVPRVTRVRDGKGHLVPQWKPLPHDSCETCHADLHAGRFTAVFAGGCVHCHVVASWKTITPGAFSHDATRYPLRGLHAKVACEKCHDPKRPWTARPKYARCDDCHADAHAGTATLRGRPADCAACHAVEGWRVVVYTAAAHAGSKYPLQGRHTAIACERCHPALADSPAARKAWGASRVVMRPAFDACVACHRDPHKGRFEPGGARPHVKRCGDCHGMDGFRPSRYDVVRHGESNYPLTGAHRATACQACHEDLKALAAVPLADTTRSREVKLAVDKHACVDCHPDPHAAQFAHRKDHGACDGCHDEVAYAPASRFVHDRDSDYKLEGAHAKAPCAGCHPVKLGADGRPVTIWRPLPAKCKDCHAAVVTDSMLVAPPAAKAPRTPAPSPPRTTPRPGGRP